MLLLIGLAVVSTGVVWIGSGWLESSSEKLAAHYELPDMVQGAVIVAVGSSFPELSAAVLSTLIHGEFELGVAAIVGSALFNILIIPALSVLVSRNGLTSNRDLVFKEAQFYMISVAVLLLTFSFAVIYNPVVTENENLILGTLDRKLALIPLVMYAVYLFLQYQDSIEYRTENRPRDIKVAREWAFLAASLLVILVGVEGLVRAAIQLGDVFDTPSFFWGITVVAAGTSVPDAFVSIRAARRGRSDTSLANVLGSNVFDLLVAIPVGVLIAGAAVINYSIAAPLMAVLTLATLLLFAMLRINLSLTISEAWILLVAYAAFIVWMALETFEVVNIVPGLPDI
ncbi:MAG: sodium:calcium antiporter [Xanthomonadales bacterium]|nr:sodium:calcium antiporter [Xanthomonadales bacterium]